MNAVPDFYNPNGIKPSTRLKLGLNHNRIHKFRCKFQDILNPTCFRRNNGNTFTHYLLYCPNYLNEKGALLNNVQNTGVKILDDSDSRISEVCTYV